MEMKNIASNCYGSTQWMTRVLSFMRLCLLAFALSTSMGSKAQNLTLYNALNCKISVKIIYGQAGCPASAPTTTQCTDLNNNGSTYIAYPAGFARVSSIEFHCGWGCASVMTTWYCAGYFSPSYFSCCGRHLTIQGGLDLGEFRIDAQ